MKLRRDSGRPHARPTGLGALIGALFSLASCAHWPFKTGAADSQREERWDPTVAIPDFESDPTLPVAVDMDGYTFQAIRAATESFLGADRTNRPCEDKEVSYRYRAFRRGDVIYVRIDYKPEACGGKRVLDGGGTYAVDFQGRILNFSPGRYDPDEGTGPERPGTPGVPGVIPAAPDDVPSPGLPIAPSAHGIQDGTKPPSAR